MSTLSISSFFPWALAATMTLLAIVFSGTRSGMQPMNTIVYIPQQIPAESSADSGLVIFILLAAIPVSLAICLLVCGS